jgi:hippurate hydrolase
MAERLRRLGFEVATGVGGHGVVGVLRNGAGPTVMLRTDMDALPVEEKTGLPYASKVTARDGAGQVVPVMHACGHDVHMTGWVGAATLLARAKERWRGTLVMVGQPAEEKGLGARRMLEAGLFKRFPRPDFAVAIHDSPIISAGQVEYVPGYAFANVDSVDVVVHGKGGHGAAPHATVDPIVIAARMVLAWQTIVSREREPFEPVVVTVGSIHGGMTHNVIPDEVRLQLTVRTYAPQVRERVLGAIARVARAEAEAAGAPRPPSVTVSEEGTPSTYNEPELTRRLGAALGRVLGEGKVREGKPLMVGEDFGRYGLEGVKSTILLVGAVEPGRFEAAKASGEVLPSLHSSTFAPDRERTLRTAITTLTVSALELLGRP